MRFKDQDLLAMGNLPVLAVASMSPHPSPSCDDRGVEFAPPRRLREGIGALLSWRFLDGVAPAGTVGYIAAATGILLTSLGIGVVLAHASIGGLAMLNLLVVLPTAVRFGRGPAIFASVAAFLAFDWFFIEPLHTFTMADPEEWIALLLFLVVAIVASHLAASQRERTHEARRREREAAALYALSRGLSATDDLDAALTGAVQQLCQDLGFAGCAVLLPVRGSAGGPTTVRAAYGMVPPGETDATPWLAPSMRRFTAEPADVQTHHWIRIRRPERGSPAGASYQIEYVPLVAGDQTVGMLRLVAATNRPPRTPEDQRLVSAAADQLGRAVERARLRHAATEAEVLRKTEEVRQAILQAVSHDLRTPLASIKGSAESLLQPDIPWTEEQRRAYLVAIHQEADHLHRLVEDLLELSRIEAGKLAPDRGWYPLDVLVDDMLAKLDSIVAGYPVTVDVPEDLPLVPLDPAQIGQVLVNLIENAAKYTPAGTPITITARPDAGAMHVSVTDGGPGIPPDALPYVFEKFYRVSGGDRATTKGTGLGLAVARRFVEAHGGAITVQSPPPGEPSGTRFSFTLPLATSGMPAPRRDPDVAALNGAMNATGGSPRAAAREPRSR
jgi:two-component system sensor histidine kinase KdpD